MGAAPTDASLYRRLIGKLNFLQHTRPDIFFSVQHLSQFLNKPQVPHMMATIHVLRFLLNAPDQGIIISKSNDFSLVAYSDSYWASCPNSRKSATGFYIILGGSPISWKSKKQPTISLSSAEAEYRALQKVVAKLSWLKRLFYDLGVPILSPISVFCDSQAAIDVNCHFVRDCLLAGLIYLHLIRSTDQLADIMTKSLSGVLHHQYLSKLSVSSPSSLRGGVDIHIGLSSIGPLGAAPD